MADRKFEFEIAATDTSFSRSMDRIGAEAKTAGAEVGRAFEKASSEATSAAAVFDRIKTTLAGAFTVGAVVQFGRAISASVIEAERSSALLNSTLRATGFAANLSSKQVEGLVQELAGISTFDDDPIRQGVVALLRFRDISGETFKEASRAAVDLAAATGKDLPSAFVAVGKALQDPASGMKALREAGVKLSEGQQDLAEKMRKSGDAAGAQKLVLEELAKSVGGAAAGEASGLYGSTRALANAWDDLLKTIGQLPAVAQSSQGAISGLTSIVNIFKRALESDAGPSGFKGGTIGIPGVLPKGAGGKIGQLSAEEVQALRDASGRAGTKDFKIAGPSSPAPAAAGGGGTGNGQRDIANLGAQIYLDQFAELERQAKVILEEAKRTRLEIEQEIIRGIGVGPELAAKQQKEFEDIAAKLVADTPIGRERAIVGVGGEIDSLNTALIKGKITAEEYEQAFQGVQDRLNEVRGVQKDFATEFSNDTLQALRAIEFAVQGWGRNFTETVVQSFKKGKFEVEDFVDSILTDMARLAVQQTISAPIFNALSQGLSGLAGLAGSRTPTATTTPNVTYSGGSPFTVGTPKATGGSVFPGMIYPINERGMEYFAPSVPGSVIPANGMRGGGGPVTLNITANVAAGADAATVRAAILDAATIAESNIAKRFRMGQ